MGVRKPSGVDIQIGAMIRARRLELGFSLEDLARALDISYQQLQKYEAGRNRLSVGRMLDIADILGVHPMFFLQPQPHRP